MKGRDSSVREDHQLIMDNDHFRFASSDYHNGFNDEYFLRKTYTSNNVLHIAIRYQNFDTVEEAVIRFPHLMWERNLDGNTPLHFVAEVGDNVFYGSNPVVREVCEKLWDPTPLRMQNSMGNTALHVAIIHNQFDVARFLVNKDKELAKIVNASMETPLHLALLHFPHPEDPDEAVDKKVERFTNLMRSRKSIYLGEGNGNYRWSEENGFQVTGEEKMGLLITMLLDAASDVAGWRDASGLTPLHRAASLPTYYNLIIINMIVGYYCPLSMEICDLSGKTILHHLIHRIVSLPERSGFFDGHIGALVNHQDQEGNTAAHLSVINNDSVMLQVLHKRSTVNYFLKNKQGESPTSLMRKHNFKFVQGGNITTEEMVDAIFRAAEHADTSTIHARHRYIGPHFSESHDSNGRSLFHKLFMIKSGHVIIPGSFLNFIEEYLLEDDNYLMVTDENGDSPLHILAQLNPNNIMIHMAIGQAYGGKDPFPGPKPDDYICRRISHYEGWSYVWENLDSSPFLTNVIRSCIKRYLRNTRRDWLMQNAKGNTVLHEAIIAQNDPVFSELAYLNSGATTLVNNRNETLLHLLAARNPIPLLEVDLMHKIIKNNTQERQRNLLDEDGLSPLMIAIKAGNIEFAERLCSICPRLAELRAFNGQSFWHMFVELPTLSFDFASSSFTHKDVWGQLEAKDKDENTALHLAIECRRFDIAELFLGLSSDRSHNCNINTRLLRISNKDGDTPGDMIGSLPYLPPKFEKFIWKDSTMIGTRSMWGIPTKQMKDYVNTMGVIAALLTTITFTAAFAVPGGLNQEKGTPLLIKEPAFQVFIISDVLAMCLSMMVLFCLLWIMATGDKSRSVVLLDFSIILLLASFYTTLLTFMTGLYATIHLVKPWIAIFSLVPCSMLLLLMHKYLVIKLIIPSGKLILIFVDMVYHSAKGAFQYASELRKRCISLIKICCAWSSSPMPMPQSPDTQAV